MNSSDFRLVKLIPITGNGSISRASDATFWDKDGVLQTAPPNTLRVTYDPSDLSKAPYALIEPEATNHIRNNTMQGAGPNVYPTYWVGGGSGASLNVLGKGVEDGIEYIDLRAQSSGAGYVYLIIEKQVQAAPGEHWLTTAYLRIAAGSINNARALFTIEEYTVEGVFLAGSDISIPLADTASRLQGYEANRVLINPSTARVGSVLKVSFSGAGDLTLRIGLPQLCRDWVSKLPIKTSGTAVTRAADVVAPGAGLLYSSVPITEPLWAAGTTYAAKVQVRDAANIVYESLVASNVGNDPTLAASSSKWLKLGATNRWKAFDKAVNSQTVGQGPLTFSMTPGALANTLMLLNVEGTAVTVSEAQSGYSRIKQLVRHDVLNWYDFYFEEPIRDGDVVFEDVPPNPNAVITVTVDNGSSDARMGCCLVGKYRTIGKTSSSMTGGVLSYSTSTTDTFGNVTMVRRNNAKRQNFDVHIPIGLEDETYRLLMQYTDVEIGVIASDRYSMGIGYGFLGQWSVPISRGGKTASIELKGLV